LDWFLLDCGFGLRIGERIDCIRLRVRRHPLARTGGCRLGYTVALSDRILGFHDLDVCDGFGGLFRGTACSTIDREVDSTACRGRDVFFRGGVVLGRLLLDDRRCVEEGRDSDRPCPFCLAC
jgi:hypothetical protein